MLSVSLSFCILGSSAGLSELSLADTASFSLCRVCVRSKHFIKININKYLRARVVCGFSLSPSNPLPLPTTSLSRECVKSAFGNGPYTDKFLRVKRGAACLDEREVSSIGSAFQSRSTRACHSMTGFLFLFLCIWKGVCGSDRALRSGGDGGSFVSQYAMVSRRRGRQPSMSESCHGDDGHRY
jgi:hypothetical protein